MAMVLLCLDTKKKNFLGQEVETFFSKEGREFVLFSSAEETQLKERGYLKNLPMIFLSKDKDIVLVD